MAGAPTASCSPSDAAAVAAAAAAAGPHPGAAADSQPAAGAAAAPEEYADVLILGSGFSGLAAAIRLQREGVTSFLIAERGPALGGTWRDNTYPGAACDIPSHLYSLASDPNPGFSRVYSRQPEIRAYLEAVADRHGLRPRIRFGAQVRRCAWDEATATTVWECADGRRFRGRFAVVAAGPLKDPKWPDIQGLAGFGGALIHSCRWPEGGLAALAGKRVAVVGTGASAVQIIPEVAAVAAHLHVIQRTPAWVAPRPDGEYSGFAKWAFRWVPGALLLARLWIWLLHEIRYPLLFGDYSWRKGTSEGLAKQLRAYIRKEVPDPQLAEALTPSYAPGCKRMLLSSDFYPAMARPNVSLHTSPATAATPGGLVLADGTRLEVDAVVCATGFTVAEPLASLEVRGAGGVDLSEVWGSRPTAYLGVSVPQLPNTFFLLGPNTGLGHNSVLLMAEAQAGYAARAIKDTMARGAAAWAAVKPGRLAAFVSEVDAAHARQVWATGGCASWYLNAEGVNFSLWPGSTAGYMWRMRRYDPRDYAHGHAAAPAGGGSAAAGAGDAAAGSRSGGGGESEAEERQALVGDGLRSGGETADGPGAVRRRKGAHAS